jgi:hypothetical protein
VVRVNASDGQGRTVLASGFQAPPNQSGSSLSPDGSTLLLYTYDEEALTRIDLSTGARSSVPAGGQGECVFDSDSAAWNADGSRFLAFRDCYESGEDDGPDHDEQAFVTYAADGSDPQVVLVANPVSVSNFDW